MSPRIAHIFARLPLRLHGRLAGYLLGYAPHAIVEQEAARVAYFRATGRHP